SAIEREVIRQNQMGAAGNKQPPFAIDTCLSKLLKFSVECSRLYYDSVSNHASRFVVKNPRRYEPENKLPVANTHGVAGVMTALVAGNYIEVRSQYVDDLAFAFVAPLCPRHDNVFHDRSSTCGSPETGLQSLFQGFKSYALNRAPRIEP